MATAMLSRNVAVFVAVETSNPAYVAGLLHDIGKVVVAVYLLEFERGLPIREAMDWIDHDNWMAAIIEELHREVGCAITVSTGTSTQRNWANYRRLRGLRRRRPYLSPRCSFQMPLRRRLASMRVSPIKTLCSQ